MFYASCAGPGVYEMRAQPGWRVAFSTWRVTELLWMHDLGFHPDVLHHLGASAVGTRPWMVEPIPNETARNRRLRKQVAQAFAVDVHASTKHLYKQSVALAEFWIDLAEASPAYPDGPKIPMPPVSYIPRCKCVATLTMSPFYRASCIRACNWNKFNSS